MSAKNVLLDVKRNVNELQFFQKILYFNFFQAFFIFDLHIGLWVRFFIKSVWLSVHQHYRDSTDTYQVPKKMGNKMVTLFCSII